MKTLYEFLTDTKVKEFPYKGAELNIQSSNTSFQFTLKNQETSNDHMFKLKPVFGSQVFIEDGDGNEKYVKFTIQINNKTHTYPLTETEWEQLKKLFNTPLRWDEKKRNFKKWEKRKSKTTNY